MSYSAMQTNALPHTITISATDLRAHRDETLGEFSPVGRLSRWAYFCFRSTQQLVTTVIIRIRRLDGTKFVSLSYHLVK
jgi:hypothetical protein